MPRDISGNYTLPAGNPVVDDTIIDVNWANPTMADIATQLNNVWTRDGNLGPTANMDLDGFKFTGAASATGSGQFLVYAQSTTAKLDSLLLGNNATAQVFSGSAADSQVVGTSADSGAFGISRFSANGNPAYLYFGKSRGTAAGSFDIVQDNDDLSDIRFYGADGVHFAMAARILIEVDGTPGAGDMPGRITLMTTPDGADIPVAALLLDSIQTMWGTRIRLSSVDAANLADDSLCGIQIGSDSGTSLRFDRNTIQCVNTAAAADLNIQEYGGSTLFGGDIVVNGSITLAGGGDEMGYYKTASYDPDPEFGGGNTGRAGTFSGWWTRIGSLVHVSIKLTFTNKGSSTGIATITLPFAARSDNSQNVAIMGTFANMAAFAGYHYVLLLGSGSASATFASTETNGDEGPVTVTHAEFTNTSEISLNFSYEA